MILFSQSGGEKQTFPFLLGSVPVRKSCLQTEVDDLHHHLSEQKMSLDLPAWKMAHFGLADPEKQV